VIESLSAIADACAIDVPVGQRRPIAIVGAGAIVDNAHLKAYRAGGLEIVGITDVNRARADEVAERHGIGRVYRNLDELLADERVEVVDIAVPAAAQPEIVRCALESGRHVLGQKPFAPRSAVAEQLVRLAKENELVLVVNQQLRFDEGMAAAHEVMRLGWLGEVTALTIAVDIWTDWTLWPWMLSLDELEVWNHSIHYHDVVRWFLGEPESVYASAGRTPGQAPRGETRTTTTYRFASGARALVNVNHENQWGDQRAEFRLDGSGGSVRGTLGLLYDYPRGRPDTLEINSAIIGTDGWLPYPVTNRWIPDAFLGPMASLLAAAAGGPTPRTAASDNVGTLALVEAIYRSIGTHTVQSPAVAAQIAATEASKE